MKKLYLFFLIPAFLSDTYSQSPTCVTIIGNRTNGKYRQLYMDSRGGTPDTTQI